MARKSETAKNEALAQIDEAHAAIDAAVEQGAAALRKLDEAVGEDEAARAEVLDARAAIAVRLARLAD